MKGFLYRQHQRWKYHVASDLFKKKVAEINRNSPIVKIGSTTFRIAGCDLNFSRDHHAFIIDCLKLFNCLLKSDGHFQIENNDLLFVIDDIRLRVTTAEEIFIIHEIYIEGCYNVSLKTDKSIVIIDIGMNVGYASLFFASRASISNVYSFEAFKPTYEQALVNINYNGHLGSKIQIHSYGLSATDMLLEVDYSPAHRGRSGIWGTELILEKTEQTSRETLTLKSFNVVVESIMKNHLDCDFIWKIDCEGSEYDIFESIDEKLFKNTRCILMEWHKKGSRPLTNKLSNNGFAVLSLNPDSRKVGMIYAFK